MRIVHVGDHSLESTRNRVVARALRRAGADVSEIHVAGRFPKRAIDLGRALRRKAFDLVFVGVPGHGNVVGVRLATLTRAPFVFDAFVSVYETAVEDRLTARKGSLASRWARVQDRLPCRLADTVLVDTNEHIRYFRDQLDLPFVRFERVWIGSDDNVMQPRPRPDQNRFRVLFVGHFIPLHGTEYIVHAASLVTRECPDVEFLMIGTGQTHAAAEHIADRLAIPSMRFIPKVPYHQLPELIASSNICLGIFGATTKAARVIPTKVFDALAMARPIVTADTPAAREVLVDRVHCRLCPPGRPDELARAILELKASPSHAEDLARKGHELFRREFSTDALARRLAVVISEIMAA